MFNEAISCNNIIMSGGTRKGVVLVKEGRIEGITDVLPEDVHTVTELGDLVLMPGIIDPHVHINEPGRAEWEGFDTATKSALAGGITSLVEMPLNASPVTTTVKAFEEKLKAAEGKLHANCGFWGGIIPGNEKEIEPLAERGVWGFKAFLTPSGIDEFPPVTKKDLRKAMPLIAKLGLPLLVHCELDSPLPADRNPQSYREYLQSRPPSWEDKAIELMIRLCEEYNCRTHIVHLSSAGSIEQIARAKAKGLPLTVETAQHYLYFSAEEIPDGRTEFKCAPPIREKANNEKLWQALKAGIIDFVATDHSPAPPSMKQAETGDLQKAWGGIASLQLALPVLWTAARKRGCSPVDLARWLCEKPALLPGLGRKGKIEAGYDADFVLWDPDLSLPVIPAILEQRHKITPYLKEELVGLVQQTWLSGLKVFERGDYPQPGAGGKFLHLNKGHILKHA